AASTGERRSRSRSATSSGSTTCRALRTACPLRVSRRRRRRSRLPARPSTSPPAASKGSAQAPPPGGGTTTENADGEVTGIDARCPEAAASHHSAQENLNAQEDLVRAFRRGARGL